MEPSAPREALDEIADLSRKLADRRGQHAAALWSMSDFFTSCDGTLISHRDTATLGGSSLTLVIDRCESTGNIMLFVVSGDERIPAYKADAEIQVAAVRRLPEFLAGYSKRLKEATGSRMTIELADQIVEAVAESSSPQPQA